MDDKQENPIDKFYEFGGPTLGPLVFVAPFIPMLIAKYQHLGLLVFVLLGLFVSYAIINTTEKLKKVLSTSKTFQQKVMVCSVINILAVVFLHGVLAMLVIIVMAFYSLFLARREHGKLVQVSNT